MVQTSSDTVVIHVLEPHSCLKGNGDNHLSIMLLWVNISEIAIAEIEFPSSLLSSRYDVIVDHYVLAGVVKMKTSQQCLSKC